MGKFNESRGNLDIADSIEKLENEKRMLNEWDQTEAPLVGRVSPFAKELIYRSYLKVTTVKDLSLKFGILPQRVKAIVYQKHLYWEEVYPKLGESHMRIAIEQEAIYAAEYPFVDYGADLALMSELEKGVRLERIPRSDADAKPNP